MIEEELSEQQVEIMQRTTEREYVNFLKMQCFPDEKNYKEVNSDGEECCSESGDSDTKRRRKGKKSPTKKRILGKTRAAKKAEMYDGMSKEEIRQVRSGRHPVKKASKIGGKKRENSEISEEDSSTCPSSPLESEYSKYKNIGVQILH
ncbi:Protein CBG26061 [Caenorhabditis briggsae]|nr:Protein CBG26061 [Caenorhabditis briggsae]CAS00824.1 Protein CBG26061 [Caenorhabditis briggsae]